MAAVPANASATGIVVRTLTECQLVRVGHPPRRPDFCDVDGGLMFGVLTAEGGFGADLSFRFLSSCSDFGPLDEKSGMPRGDFFFMRWSGSRMSLAVGINLT